MPCFNALRLPWGSPADPSWEACEFLPLSVFQRVKELFSWTLECLAWARGRWSTQEWMFPEEHQPPKDKPLWTIAQLAYLSVGQYPRGACSTWVPVAQAVTHSWAYVYSLSSLPASVPHSLMSLDSNLWLRISFGGNSLTWQTHWGDTEKLPNCHKTPIFFFQLGK